jgi:23S rRNA pseudouridine2605 synthase
MKKANFRPSKRSSNNDGREFSRRNSENDGKKDNFTKRNPEKRNLSESDKSRNRAHSGEKNEKSFSRKPDFGKSDNRRYERKGSSDFSKKRSNTEKPYADEVSNKGGDFKRERKPFERKKRFGSENIENSSEQKFTTDKNFSERHFGKPRFRKEEQRNSGYDPEIGKRKREEKRVKREMIEVLGNEDFNDDFSKDFIRAKSEGGKFPQRNSFERKPYGDRPKSFEKKQFSREGGEADKSKKGGFDRNIFREGNTEGGGKFSERSRDNKPRFERGERKFDKPRFERGEREERKFDKPRFERGEREERKFDKPRFERGEREERKSSDAKDTRDKKGSDKQKKSLHEKNENPRGIRLNRFIANSGICSRRDADNLIAKGEITVNGTVVTEMGYMLKPSDKVEYQGKILKAEQPVYVLLNKPKDFITTTDDPQERKTVMNLVADATDARIYPVGRLDRNTTGVLLLTNDGELAKKLTHPSHKVQKIYRVEIDKRIKHTDLEQIARGFELEDGFVEVNNIAVLSEDGRTLGVEIHIGRNRIVRRIFEHFGYEVVKLDRTSFAGLTKENLSRGQWRKLTPNEVIRLKFFLSKV